MASIGSGSRKRVGSKREPQVSSNFLNRKIYMKTLTTGNYNVIYSSLIINKGLFTQVIETLSADSVSVMQPRYAAGNFRSWSKEIQV